MMTEGRVTCNCIQGEYMTEHWHFDKKGRIVGWTNDKGQVFNKHGQYDGFVKNGIRYDSFCQFKGFSGKYGRINKRGKYEGGNYPKKNGCYLATACLHHAGLDDKCEELEIMRRFRDEYVSNCLDGKILVAKYYRDAPSIVANIMDHPYCNDVFSDIYATLLNTVKLIRGGNYYDAMNMCVMTYESFKHYRSACIENSAIEEADWAL